MMSNNGDDNSDGPIRFRKSPLVNPSGHPLLVEPGETLMDDTSRIALGALRFKTEIRSVNVITGENELVPYYKQVMTGEACKHEQHREEDDNGDEKGALVETAYCPVCFNTLRPPGYKAVGYVKLLDVYIEWGGTDKHLPGGRFVAHVDFDYYVTPGDFFELGNVVAEVGFNVGAGYAERHDNEGAACLWRVLNVTTVHDSEDQFPLMWEIEGTNVEQYEPVMGWFVQHCEAVDDTYYNGEKDS